MIGMANTILSGRGVSEIVVRLMSNLPGDRGEDLFKRGLGGGVGRRSFPCKHNRVRNNHYRLNSRAFVRYFRSSQTGIKHIRDLSQN